ncbi:hypothetical protein [uncultured Roseobacter sp.]|uniref:hypothetical protein n=1 Tax=uncultured Roseobacter sp. TaxID=114847 RepID=UPI002637969A|nr:hypothetical protein [uncultured Roseobacter sp.]
MTKVYAGIRPHSPVVTPLFGIVPFLGASVSIALSAIIVQPLISAAGRTLSSLAALTAHLHLLLKTFLRFQEFAVRLQKFIFQGAAVWPVAATGSSPFSRCTWRVIGVFWRIAGPISCPMRGKRYT